MQWTHEQSPIIQSKAPKILVRAFAGTGKTTTLVGFAKANPTLRILYLCYNSSVEKAAKGKFPATWYARPPTAWLMRCMASSTPTRRRRTCV